MLQGREWGHLVPPGLPALAALLVIPALTVALALQDQLVRLDPAALLLAPLDHPDPTAQADLPALEVLLSDLPAPLDQMATQAPMERPVQKAPLVPKVALAPLDLLAPLDHNHKSMNAWWQHFDRALTPEDCQALTEYALTIPPATGTIGHGGKGVVDPNMRRSTVRWLQRDDELLYTLFAKIERMALQANANAFGFDLAGFHEVQFTEYDAGQAGHYDWHEDNCWKHAKPFDRKMSMVIQLSDPSEYEGGKLLLHNDPLPDNVFTNQGSALFFPSFNRHKVTPLTAGKRFSLVTWFVGPQFR